MNSDFHHKHIWIFLFFSCISRFAYSQEISPNVRVASGSVNGVFIERNGKTLVVYGDPKDELKKADMVLFTHFRRDVIGAGRNLVGKGATAVAPIAQREYFTKGDSIWVEIARKQFREHSNRTTKIAVLPISVNRFVKGGETLQWQDLNIKVLNTTAIPEDRFRTLPTSIINDLLSLAT